MDDIHKLFPTQTNYAMPVCCTTDNNGPQTMSINSPEDIFRQSIGVPAQITPNKNTFDIILFGTFGLITRKTVCARESGVLFDPEMFRSHDFFLS